MGAERIRDRRGLTGAMASSDVSLTGLRRTCVGAIVLAVFFLLAVGYAHGTVTETEETEEARGFWVVRDSLRTPQTIDQFLHMAEQLRINTLFVQVNGRAEAYYRSALVPSPPDLADGFDPLQYVIEGAQRRGIDVHAWVNAFTVSMLGSRPSSPRHVLRQHPEWVLYHRSGKSLWDFGSELVNTPVPALMLDPGLPEVQDYVVAVVEEIVRNYDVDGIHLDYLRYPSPDYGYHPEARARFQELVGIDPLWLTDPEQRAALRAAWGSDVVERVDEAWREWRRRQVTGIMRRIYRSVERWKPWVKVSAAVFPDVERARDYVLQDWPAWLQEGIVDFVAPMAYSPDEHTVDIQLQRAVALAGDRHVYAGLGIYRLEGRPDLLRAIVARARAAGVKGLVFFSYNYLQGDPAMVSLLRDEAPAVSPRVPAMPWKQGRSERAAGPATGGEFNETSP